MTKALVRNDVVIDIEKRDIDVYEYYHKDIADMFIDCPEDTEIGYLYVGSEFVNPNPPEEVEADAEPEVTE